MGPLEYAIAVAQFIMSFYEKKQEKEKFESIKRAIKDATTTIINTLEKHERIKHEGGVQGLFGEYNRLMVESIEWDHGKLDECKKIPITDKPDMCYHLRGDFGHLKDGISSLAGSFESFCYSDLDFFTFELYPAYIKLKALELSVFIFSENRLKMASSGRLALENCLEPQLKVHHIVSKRIYEHLHYWHPANVEARKIKSKYSLQGYAKIKADVNIQMTDMILFEQYLQQIRYLYIHNLNSNFRMQSDYRNSKYAGFQFNCSAQDIVQVDDKNYALAVHNQGGNSLKSIYKDVPDLPNEAEIRFEVNLSSQKIDREVEVIIYELDPNTKAILDKEPKGPMTYVINKDWQKITQLYTKKYRDTIIRFEIYWFDDEPLNLYVTDVFFTYCPVLLKTPSKIDWLDKEAIACTKTQETPDIHYKEFLPFLSYYSWEHRSTNKALYFGLSDDYITTQWLAANNSNQDFQPPSYIYDVPIGLYVEWLDLDFTFEVFIKSAVDNGTEILLAVHEFDTHFNVVKTHYGNGGGFQKITTDWELFSLKCNRSAKYLVRCEIYWNGDHKSDVLIRDARILYHKKV
ncbi:hypothetical protein [Bacillus paranthracis]|uniref:hypothetical protein n=1 Tax=Bacillus paranthracis TaxID=2026186 RepID=UPI00298C10F7|nr:hypothetical protein [Bacillus paranthracis]